MSLLFNDIVVAFATMRTFIFSLLISESNDNTFDDSIQCFLRNHAAKNVLPYKTRMLLRMYSRTRRNDSNDARFDDFITNKQCYLTTFG